MAVTGVTDAILAMSRGGLGLVVVLDDDGRTLGIFTDGDLRRTFDGRVNVHQTQMRTDFELVARGLVHVRRTEHRENALVGGQRNGSAYHRAGALHRLHDLLGALVDEVVIVRPQLDPDLLGHRSLRVRLKLYHAPWPIRLRSRCWVQVHSG